MRNLFFVLLSLIFGIFGGFLSFYFLSFFKVSPYYFFPSEQITIKKEIKVEEKKKILEEAVEKVQKSVFLIKRKEKISSGFVLTSDGLGITLAENLKKAKEISFFLKEEKIEGEVIKIDENQNLALIKLKKENFPVFSFEEKEKVKLGRAIFVVGAILDEKGEVKFFVEEGIIKAKGKDFFETNIKEIGNEISGAPVFDFETKFLGIALQKNGKVFILPAEKIKIFANL
jgi:S1-C subfamily serine protease